MLRKKNIQVLGLWMIAMTAVSAFAQTDSVFPWITNNDSFGSSIVINNLNDMSVDVTLTATRADGTSQTVTETIAAYGQFVGTSGNVFDQLGLGGGYAVTMTSEASNIRGAFVVRGLSTSSGSSPAQADVVTRASAGQILLYNYMPSSNGFSAPVLVNMGDTDANVTFHAFQNGQRVASSSAFTVAPNHPTANLVSDLFADIDGELYVVAESDQPVVGVAFIFNSFREPSMASASVLDAIPGAPSAGGEIDIDMIRGANFSYDLVSANPANFHVVGNEQGLYIVHPLLGVTPWNLAQSVVNDYFDGSVANEEAVKIFIDTTTTLEQTLSGGDTGNGMVAGVIRVQMTNSDSASYSYYVNVPSAEALAAVAQFFGVSL